MQKNKINGKYSKEVPTITIRAVNKMASDLNTTNTGTSGLLHSFIFNSYHFTGLPLSGKKCNRRFLRSHRQLFGFTPGVCFPKTSLHHFCYKAQVFAHRRHHKIIPCTCFGYVTLFLVITTLQMQERLMTKIKEDIYCSHWLEKLKLQVVNLLKS